MSKSKREVSKLLMLLLVMPVTNATSEHSFSALRRNEILFVLYDDPTEDEPSNDFAYS